MKNSQPFCIEVKGDFACFTRPEMKVERVSYDVITPSAARGIFEAILWKPAIKWQVNKLEVLKPINWVNIRRNEVKDVVSTSNVKIVMGGGNKELGIFVDAGKQRQQRAGLFLRDVAYRLHATFYVQDDRNHIHRYPHLMCSESGTSENSVIKFAEMFKRRASRGQCFNQPYLGTREFSCSFKYIEQEQLDKEKISHPPVQISKELGWMLYDMDFSDLNNPTPRFFDAEMIDGVINVPDWDSEEVRG